MASESTAKVVEKKAPSAVPKDRRYVGSKETFAYILDDIAQSFNIGKYDDVFKMNILKIDLVLQSVTCLLSGTADNSYHSSLIIHNCYG